MLDAVRSVMTCEPDYLVMGMSAVTFYGGGAGADAFQAKVERESGVGVGRSKKEAEQRAAREAYARLLEERGPVRGADGEREGERPR